MTGYNETEAKKAFDAAHGPERVEWNFMFYYPDGASRTNEPISEMREPPADEFERLQMILTFHRARLTRATQAFENLKDDLSHRSGGNGNELSRLEDLQAIVFRRRKEVAKAQAALDDTEVGKMRRGAKEAEQERLARHAEWQDKLKGVKI